MWKDRPRPSGSSTARAHALVDDLAEAQLAGTREAYLAHVTTVPLLIIDDLGMRKLPHTAAEDLLEIVMRRYERTSTLLTSNRPVEDWGKLLGDTAAVTAMLDRLLHHAHVLAGGPRGWRTPPAQRQDRLLTTVGDAGRMSRLAQSCSNGVEEDALGAAPYWPVFRCPRLAAFQLSTEDSDGRRWRRYRVRLPARTSGR
jgi:IstB-like ATP binding protein